MNRRFERQLAAAGLALCVAACGGGGGGSNDTPVSTALSVSVDGRSAATMAEGDTLTLDVQSGQDVRIDSSMRRQWTWNYGPPAWYGTTVAWQPNEDGMRWDAVVASVAGDTVTVTITREGAAPSTLNVRVAPTQYAPSARQIGQYTLWHNTALLMDSSTTSSDEKELVTALNGDNSATVAWSMLATGAVTETRQLDSDGNRLSRSFSSGSTCVYSPARQLKSFPLAMRKTWTATWDYQCGAPSNYHESATSVSTVQGYEKVTVAAGTFDSLRIVSQISFSGSNDANLPHGATGNASYRIDQTCWWAIDLRRDVKCSWTYSYPEGAPGNYQASGSQEVTEVH